MIDTILLVLVGVALLGATSIMLLIIAVAYIVNSILKYIK
jgi:hypothetical protein